MSAAEEATECTYPGDITALSSGDKLELADTCGMWSLELGAHLYVVIPVDDETTTCTGFVGSAVDQPYEPIYSAFGDGGGQYTFDFEAVAVSVDSEEIGVVCDDGTDWYGKVTVF